MSALGARLTAPVGRLLAAVARTKDRTLDTDALHAAHDEARADESERDRPAHLTEQPRGPGGRTIRGDAPPARHALAKADDSQPAERQGERGPHQARSDPRPEPPLR
ncbi:hypothetical protein [Streptomyces radicis]|uniref:hypothetical protein n=1 Tax=Streptomyces radicis TaxID=1750517 RepID=UPI0011C35DA3|nr:hypothetical protein [Streptomyces radicis]